MLYYYRSIIGILHIYDNFLSKTKGQSCTKKSTTTNSSMQMEYLLVDRFYFLNKNEIEWYKKLTSDDPVGSIDVHLRKHTVLARPKPARIGPF
jgi:hypothetical protein